jgi:hypothetical protein
MQWKAEIHLNYIPTGKEVNGPDSYLEGKGKAGSEPSPRLVSLAPLFIASDWLHDNR